MPRPDRKVIASSVTVTVKTPTNSSGVKRKTDTTNAGMRLSEALAAIAAALTVATLRTPTGIQAI
jgi:hypothetical protein